MRKTLAILPINMVACGSARRQGCLLFKQDQAGVLGEGDVDIDRVARQRAIAAFQRGFLDSPVGLTSTKPRSNLRRVQPAVELAIGFGRRAERRAQKRVGGKAADRR